MIIPDPIILTVLVIVLAITLYSDMRFNKIKNLWIGLGVLLAFASHLYLGGWSGLGSSFLGLLVGFGLFLPLYMLGGMAAGDVKLMAAVGAILGVNLAWIIVLATLICGGLLALLYLAIRRDLLRYLQRWYAIITNLVLTRNINSSYLDPADNEVARHYFPYALAITSGVVVSLVLFVNKLPDYMLFYI